MARGEPVGSLDEQFKRWVLEGVGMDAHDTQPCSEVITGLCREGARRLVQFCERYGIPT